MVNAFWIHLWFMKCRFVRYRFVRYWFRFVSRPWLDTDIPSKHFFVSKTSSRHVLRTSSLVLLRNNFSPYKMSSKRLARCFEDAFKTYLQEVFKTSWKTNIFHAEDVLKTSSRPANVCWVCSHKVPNSSTRQKVSEESTWFIHFDGLSSYYHSFHIYLAARFFKNNISSTKILKQDLISSSDTFYRSIFCRFLQPQRHFYSNLDISISGYHVIFL